MTPEEILIEQEIPYTEKGKDLIISCLSPDHEDNNPSMHVDKTAGIGHCFSCGATISVFTRFNKILNTLTIKQQSILDMINDLGAIKLSPPEDANIFNEEFRGIKPETFNNFGVFKSEKDIHQGRVVLPIYNFKRDIVAFIGRYQYSKIDPRYKVSPAGKALPLFPPAIDIEGDTIIIVEGMFDMLNLYDKGLKNVITGFGLVTPSKKDKYNVGLHERFMPYKIAGIHQLYIVYDSDSPGIKAAYKLASALEDFMFVEVIILDEGKDPGSLNQKEVNQLKKQIEDNNNE